VKIVLGDPFHPPARELLEASHALMTSLFPKESNHFLSLNDLKAPNISFFVASDEEQTLGCAALAHMGNYGELKSMYVRARARGHGVARALLARIESEARKKELRILRLETGDKLHDAHRLYGKSGFVERKAFGDYPPDSPHSQFMEKRL